jgi:hypothetical protein
MPKDFIRRKGRRSPHRKNFKQPLVAGTRLWRLRQTKRRAIIKISGEVSSGGEPKKCFSGTLPACLYATNKSTA